MMKTKEKTDPPFENLIEHIQQERGFDFRGYKRSSLRRRIDKRMADISISNIESYRAYIEANPSEYMELLNTILINVTSFFRDPPAWKTLRTKVIPEIISRKSRSDHIRIWSAGCATGEEPYSLAMLFAEALGGAKYRQKVKIYATDLDDDALEFARRAKFTAKNIEAVPKKLCAKYFNPSGDNYVFNRDLRKAVIFGRHDIVNDAPISNIDLLVCRNVLIYLDSQTQNQVLPRLYFGLTEGGCLFLGKAETLLIRSPLFKPIDVKSRIFSKIPQPPGREEVLAASIGKRAPETAEVPEMAELMARIINKSAVGYLVINAGGQLVFANEAARRLFDLGRKDIGRPFQDLEVFYYPVELRRHINKAIKGKMTVRVEEAATSKIGSNLPHLSVEISAIVNGDDRHQATILSFHDTTAAHELRLDLQATNEAMETTNEELQSSNEELETTNEELQSTNEELETTNEELQSTNEELETTNEELQSTNEELETTNEELHVRGEELNTYRNVMEATLSSIDVGVIIVDNKSCVTQWNRKCQNLWGLRQEETVGEPLLNLDFGLPVEKLKRPLRQVLSGKQKETVTEMPAIDRRGRAINCRVEISPLDLGGDRVTGAVLMTGVEKITSSRSVKKNNNKKPPKAKPAGGKSRTRPPLSKSRPKRI